MESSTLEKTVYVDWAERPWGRPIITPAGEQEYLESGVFARVDFRYHGIKVRAWRLVRAQGGRVSMLPPAIDILYGEETYRQSAAYFLSAEEDRRFKDDVAYVLDAVRVPRWKVGERID